MQGILPFAPPEAKVVPQGFLPQAVAPPRQNTWSNMAADLLKTVVGSAIQMKLQQKLQEQQAARELAKQKELIQFEAPFKQEQAMAAHGYTPTAQTYFEQRERLKTDEDIRKAKALEQQRRAGMAWEYGLTVDPETGALEQPQLSVEYNKELGKNVVKSGSIIHPNIQLLDPIAKPEDIKIQDVPGQESLPTGTPKWKMITGKDGKIEKIMQDTGQFLDSKGQVPLTKDAEGNSYAIVNGVPHPLKGTLPKPINAVDAWKLVSPGYPSKEQDDKQKKFLEVLAETKDPMKAAIAASEIPSVSEEPKKEPGLWERVTGSLSGSKPPVGPARRPILPTNYIVPNLKKGATIGNSSIQETYVNPSTKEVRHLLQDGTVVDDNGKPIR